MEQRLTCLLCGRNKFEKRTAHKCAGGYRKHGLKWAIVTNNAVFKLKKKVNKTS